MQPAGKTSNTDRLVSFLFWIGILMVVHAVGFFLGRDAFPSGWFFWSIAAGVLGAILLLVLREIERSRGGEGFGRWRDAGPEDIFDD